MSLTEHRRRLPIVASLPAPDSRQIKTPLVPGAVPTPRYAVWELTLKCDQKCIHCGSRAGHRRPNELTTDEALAVVADLRTLGVGELTVIGGEAYLRDDFITIVRAARMAGMRCTMTTGGYNLGQARCEALAEAGISAVSVSIDGTEAAHDHLRAVPGSFNNAFAAIARLRSVGIQATVNTQINRLTMPTLADLQELLLAAGIRLWQLQVTAPFGNAADHPEILLQPYMYPELFELLDRILARGAPVGMRLFPGNNLGYFGPFESRLRALQKTGGHYKGCYAGRRVIGLEADGTVKGCPSLGGPANHAGNVRERSLVDLWADAPALQFTRQRDVTDLWGYCRDCYYNDICMAGCSATSEPLLGRPGNNPLCHHRAQELARIGQRERIELVTRAPGVPFDHGLYRVIREHADPEQRARHGPISIDEPRCGRDVEPRGPGTPISTGSGP